MGGVDNVDKDKKISGSFGKKDCGVAIQIIR